MSLLKHKRRCKKVRVRRVDAMGKVKVDADFESEYQRVFWEDILKDG